MSNKIKEFYDATASKYDLRQDNPSTKHLREAEEKFLKKFAKSRILDVGCGTGYHLAFLEKNGLGEELIGVDISREMLKEARNKCSCSLIEAPADNLPFPDDSFDIAICFHGVFNFVDADMVIAEMKRVLKSSGIVMLSVFSVWDKDYPRFMKKLDSNIGNMTKISRVENTKLSFNLFSKKNLIELFEKHSFQMIYLKGLFIYQRPYWGRFEPFGGWQKIKLELDNILPFNTIKEAGTVYLAAFRKK